MGLQDKLSMIHHYSGNGFFCLNVDRDLIIKLRGVAREFKDMVSDTRRGNKDC